MCAYNVCPPVTCADPEPIPGSCCLGCPEIEPPKYERGCIDENQQSIRSRESWQADQCKTCMCIDGDISCTSQECEVNLTCDMLVLQKGKCCPICLGLFDVLLVSLISSQTIIHKTTVLIQLLVRSIELVVNGTEITVRSALVFKERCQNFRNLRVWFLVTSTKGKHKCFTEICTAPAICPSGAKPIKVDGYCCEVCPTTNVEVVQDIPICYTKMCRWTVAMVSTLVILTILSIMTFCYVTKSNKADYMDPVIPRPTPMPRLSDSQPNLSISRSPALVRLWFPFVCFISGQIHCVRETARKSGDNYWICQRSLIPITCTAEYDWCDILRKETFIEPN